MRHGKPSKRPAPASRAMTTGIDAPKRQAKFPSPGEAQEHKHQFDGRALAPALPRHERGGSIHFLDLNQGSPLTVEHC